MKVAWQCSPQLPSGGRVWVDKNKHTNKQTHHISLHVSDTFLNIKYANYSVKYLGLNINNCKYLINFQGHGFVLHVESGLRYFLTGSIAHSAKRRLFKLLTGRYRGFLSRSPQRRLVVPMGVKFGMEEGTFGDQRVAPAGRKTPKSPSE